jgi:hypothetical protein
MPGLSSHHDSNDHKKTLAALTTAALVLPGLIQPTARAAEEDSVDFQYSHYQEGKRYIYQSVNFSDLVTGVRGINGIHKQDYNNPIEVDSLHGGAKVSLTDRIKFSFNYLQDTWSGATPVGTAPALLSANGAFSPSLVNSGASPWGQPSASDIYIDREGNIYGALTNFIDGSRSLGGKSNQITHVMSYASPEMRKQGDFTLSYDWDNAAVNVGGGISTENDYESRFGNLGLRLDFNQKQTVLNLGLSYTNIDTHARLDPELLLHMGTVGYDEPYFDSVTGEQLGYRSISGSPAQIDSELNPNSIFRSQAFLNGKRQDWGGQLGLTQVLGTNNVLELGFGYTRSTGYLANPYKVVYFLHAIGFLNDDPNKPIAFQADQAGARLEKRPEERNQFNWNVGYKHYITMFDAALHFDYRFAHDDWGINAQTFEADWVQPMGKGWTVTPRIRYYSQSAADFYVPFVLTTADLTDPTTGLPVNTPYPKTAPEFYSSDQRLSGFGALSGGVTVAKQFGKGISLETGFEYYTHQGNLKIGGGGEQAFADYDYWVANAALKVNLEAVITPGALGSTHHAHHQHSNAPAGVMFDHALAKSGDFMVGYRYMRNEQAGDMLHGNQSIGINHVFEQGCGDFVCSTVPDFMTMSMHMLDLMYAPTDWLSLMLMPQWTDMDMEMSHNANEDHAHIHRAGLPVSNHQSGGIGDTGVYALFKVLDRPHHNLTFSLGGTAPTGDMNIKLRKTYSVTRGFYNVPLHYGMQLGSGTWDFKPSLTYTGEADNFIWGAQLTGTKRLESRNSANFAFGDIFQGSVWGGYQWTNWLTTTVRGVYTTQGSIHGEYLPVYYPNTNPPREFKPVHVGPFDQTSNYGGRFWDLGLGVNVTIPHSAFAGNALKFEWLQPVYTDFNGYQLDRDYALNFTWSYGF